MQTYFINQQQNEDVIVAIRERFPCNVTRN